MEFGDGDLQSSRRAFRSFKKPALIGLGVSFRVQGLRVSMRVQVLGFFSVSLAGYLAIYGVEAPLLDVHVSCNQLPDVAGLLVGALPRRVSLPDASTRVPRS